MKAIKAKVLIIDNEINSICLNVFGEEHYTSDIRDIGYHCSDSNRDIITICVSKKTNVKKDKLAAMSVEDLDTHYSINDVKTVDLEVVDTKYNEYSISYVNVIAKPLKSLLK